MRSLLCLFLLPIFLLSCKTEKDKNDCADVACTLEFRSIQVSVEDKEGHAVLLDKYYTVNTADNDTIHGEHPHQPGDKLYTVLDDGYTREMLNSEVDFRFIGILNSTVVVNEPYTFSADCCHISKVSGKEEIVID